MKTYRERVTYCQNPVGKQLLNLMEDKKTNLSLSADVISADALLRLADTLGPQICVLKTHIDIVEDFDPSLTKALSELARKHDFLIFEDRKFADIGHTVGLQYEKGIYQIANWAHITNAHTVPGPGVIAGLKKGGLERGNALLLLAEMSAEGTLAHGEYTQRSIEMAEANQDFVIGFIARNPLSSDPGFIHFTPGIQFAETGDGLGQQYITPEHAIIHRHTDVIIVGRGIYEAIDVVNAAEQYRLAGWDAYQRRVGLL